MSDPTRARETERSDRKKASVLIVDDHPIVRMGLAQLIDQQADLGPCIEADGIRPALDAISSSKPDIVVIDISLGGESGIELIKDIQARWPGTPMLVLSMHDEALYEERALRAGADGYIMKQEGATELYNAIDTVAKGEVYLSRKMATKLLRVRNNKSSDDHAMLIESLSDRELQVLQLLGAGLTTNQVSEKLSLSTKTVETYYARIKEKLGLTNFNQLILHAVQWNSWNSPSKTDSV